MWSPPREIELLASEASRLRRRASAALRVNPDVEAGAHPHISTGKHDHKFGIDWQHAWKLYLAHHDSKWIAWKGISAHIGSQILSVAPYREAVGKLAGLRTWIKARRRFAELCGYRRRLWRALHHREAAAIRKIRPGARRGAEGHRLPRVCEPGRALVANAGVLLMRVLLHERRPRQEICDRRRRHERFPAAGALRCRTSDYARHAAPRRDGTCGASDAAIAGPVCETGDVFLDSWPLPETKAGDLLVLWGAGAYGFVQASNYNSRPRPAEVLVEGSRFRMIRKRESVAELMRGE